ncbi:MAG: dipeptidase [Synergistaceae bacterium]|nr:dipeptidase [Synergistaceae bacterium]
MSMFEKARELHQKFLVADAHNDILCNVLRKRGEGRVNVIETDYLEDMKAGGVNLVICSLYVNDDRLPEMALRTAIDQIAALYEEERESPGKFRLCRSAAEIKAAANAGEVAFLLSFEGVEPLGRDLSLLRIFYELGVRGVGIVWSRRNAAADGCSFKAREEGQRGGLTHWGVALLKEIERLGMYVDISHLNDEGVSDVEKFYKRPYMASHSNSRKLTPVMRNLTEEQIKEIASRGGFIGMNVCSAFCGDMETGKITEKHLFAHVKEMLALSAPVGFGFDFCDEIRKLYPKPPENYDSIPSYASSVELTALMLENGISEQEIEKILGANLLNFIEKVIG